MQINIIIVGYYNKNNFGDDLFLELAKKIFSKYSTLNCRYMGLDNIGHDNIEETCNFCDKIILFGGETINDYFLDKLIYIHDYGISNLKKYIL